jgi:hypothetical protein
MNYYRRCSYWLPLNSEHFFERIMKIFTSKSFLTGSYLNECLYSSFSRTWNVWLNKLYLQKFATIWTHTRSVQKYPGQNFFIEKLLIILKWQPCRILGNISWRHRPEDRMADWLSREWVQSCLSLRRIVKWMCWRNNVFASSSARNLERRPQKRTKCSNKHSEKQRWVGLTHLSGIPYLKMAARPSTMIHAQTGYERREPTRLLIVSMQ